MKMKPSRTWCCNLKQFRSLINKGFLVLDMHGAVYRNSILSWGMPRPDQAPYDPSTTPVPDHEWVRVRFARHSSPAHAFGVVSVE